MVLGGISACLKRFMVFVPSRLKFSRSFTDFSESSGSLVVVIQPRLLRFHLFHFSIGGHRKVECGHNLVGLKR